MSPEESKKMLAELIKENRVVYFLFGFSIGIVLFTIVSILINSL